MAINNSTNYHDCIDERSGVPLIVVTCIALPFHAFIIKILAMDFQFDLARHKILFSLSLSDVIMLFGMFISAIVNMAVTITTESTGCVAFRSFTGLTSVFTLTVSSTSTIALSVERYIACIHSFRLHSILTESRVRNFAIFQWIFGCLIGLLVAVTNRYDSAIPIPNYSSYQYVYIIFVIPTSVAATVIQVRLFIFSWKKMNRVDPNVAFGEQLELTDFRRKQIRVAFMAGIVAFAYIVCMIPLAVTFLYELLSGATVPLSYRSVCISLSCSNNFADPFIYGLGIADTRQKIVKELKKLKQRLLEMVAYSV